MSKKLLKKNIGSMSLGVFISRISGLLRDQVFAYFFGATYIADAFNFAYTIPNLLRRLFGEGALGAAFIPLYQEKGVKEGKKKQIDFAINILSLLTLFLSILSVLGIIFAPFIIKFLVVYTPNLAKHIFGNISKNIGVGFDYKTLFLTIKLTRILFPYLFFIGVSSTLIAILNSHNYYFLPGISSALLNFSMVGILIWSHYSGIIGKPILAQMLCFGVLLGGFLQVVINFPILKKIGYVFKVNLSLKSRELKEFWTKFLPGVWGVAVRQINLLVDKTLASMLVTGSISALNYGNRIMQLPMGIFGISVATAVIPHFSKNIAAKNYKEFNEKLSYSISLVGFIMLPITALIVVEGRDYLQILFMRGAFDNRALIMSYNALLFYSLGLIFYVWNRIYTAVFYAVKNTKTPFIIATIIVFVNVFLNIYLMRLFSYKGLALATSLSAFFQFVLVLFIIRRKYSFVLLGKPLMDVLKIIISSVFLYFFLKWFAVLIKGNTFYSALLRASLVSIIGVILFFGITFLLNVKVARTILHYEK